MNCILLSGNSLKNRDWIYDARQRLAELFDDTYIHDYNHWVTKEPWIDIKYELKALENHRVAEPYCIFAKSIGTVLAIQAIEQKIIQPKFALFNGIPLNYINDNYEEFGDLLSKSDVPITIVQNDLDPVGSYEQVSDFISRHCHENPLVTLEAGDGNTHDYLDYDLMKKLIKQMMPK